jgi:hypothetical protein
MQKVYNLYQRNTTVVIDDMYFVDSRFDSCKIVYGGADAGWDNTLFVNCELLLVGAAAHTLEVASLMGFKLVNAEPAVHKVDETFRIPDTKWIM